VLAVLLYIALPSRPGREYARGDFAREFFFLRLHDFSSVAREYHAVPHPKNNARTTTGRSNRQDSLSGVPGKSKREESGRKLNGAVDRSSDPRCRNRSRKRARKVSGIDNERYHVVELTRVDLTYVIACRWLRWQMSSAIRPNLNRTFARWIERRRRRPLGAAYGDYNIRYVRL